MNLAKCAAVLRAAAAGPLTVSGVAASVGLPKSTTSRLLAAMAREGFLELAEGGRGYRPGPVVVAAAQYAAPRDGLVERLDDMLREVVERFGHTGYISLLDGAEVVGVKVREGTNALRVVTPPGTRYPAFATSTGRALLARLDDAEIARLHPAPLAPPTAAAPSDLAELRRRLAEVRRTGLAVAEGEANRGAGNYAVAVADPAAGQVAAACVSFPAAVCDAAERAAIAAALVEGARRAATATGDAFWTHRPPMAVRDDIKIRRRVA